MALCIFLLLLLGVLSAIFLTQRKKKDDRIRKLPPGPRKLPFIGNLHQLSELPHRSLQLLSHEHGPLMFLQLGRIPTLVVSSANAAREVFKTHDIVFSGRPVQCVGKKLSYGCLDVVFAPYGEYWRQVRKISILELLSLKRVQSFRRAREEEVGLLIDTICRSAFSSVPVNLSEMMLSLANRIVCRAAFGKKYDGNCGEYGKSKFHGILQETQPLLGGFFVSDYFPQLEWINKITGMERRLEKNFRELDNLYNQVISEHLNPERPEPEHEDLVDVLLRVAKDQTFLNEEHIKAILTDMFIAGTDTSSAVQVWTMTELIRNPTLMNKAQDEVRKNIGRKEHVEESDLHRLNYLKLVVKESMRLHPPVPLLVPRETTAKCTVGGYEIPAKTMVIINAKAISMDRKCWENPEEFRPERFIDNPVDFRGQDFELIPFGTGRRGCPGINFAVSLIELTLANLLHRFDWKLPHGERMEHLDMSEAPGMTTHKKVPLSLLATVNTQFL